ncbi:hypothetical protein QUF88_17055 [Bacillus sp. DX1.1]|uniref:hypothetical protein n=1 Tax=unclassified Bacillus (in: firmicutes) TaxID=185979 RepID=UPI00257003EE|nr:MULTISPECIES: hypothetical protein [unclassified Bacillus (in: firmicutes)]MDM5155450.1 hypothetical protein [Bacillus sp. DX1.1]WJE79763.1 hypothetical protein QRE67_14580 [Bacillus sp. DX3.1]
MKKKRSYSTEKANVEYGGLYIWARFGILSTVMNGLLVLMFGQFNVFGDVVNTFLEFLFPISAFFMIFHLVRYLRYYFRQE